MNEGHQEKHLQVNQTSGTGAPSLAPHPTALLGCLGQAFPRLVPCRFPQEDWEEEGKQAHRWAGETKLP